MCKLQKPRDGTEAVIRLGIYWLSEVWASSGLKISGMQAAPEEPQGPSVLGRMRHGGDNIPSFPYFTERLK